MYKLVTADQMREIEAHTFDLGLPSTLVMENAALCVSMFIAEKFSAGLTVAVVCGKGNNGGDGFAIARHLLIKGFNVTIIKAFEQIMTKDARFNFEITQKLGIKITENIEILHSADIIVDAVLGTGIKGEVTLPLIDSINQSPAYVVAVDIPSGICSDRGVVCGKAVKADTTITFGYKKTGIRLYPGASFAGEIKVCDISLCEHGTFWCFEPGMDDVAGWIPQTKADANKGDMGKLFVLAGSPGMTGAAELACNAALRTGAGLVTLGIPADLNPIMEVKLTEAMTLPLDCKEFFTLEAVQKVLPKIMAASCAVIGPGLGKNSEILPVLTLLLQNNVPLIIDADGINAVAMNIDILNGHLAPVILTPHLGEFARLCGCDIPAVQSNRLTMAREFAVKYQVVLVLKGAGTVVALPNGECYINPTGNAGMATGGSGDVLSGMIGALLSRGMPEDVSAIAGAYLHGLAGDIAKEKWGQDGMIPTDIISCVPHAMQRIKNPGH